jgi:hypothetical protein
MVVKPPGRGEQSFYSPAVVSTQGISAQPLGWPGLGREAPAGVTQDTTWQNSHQD